MHTHAFSLLKWIYRPCAASGSRTGLSALGFPVGLFPTNMAHYRLLVVHALQAMRRTYRDLLDLYVLELVDVRDVCAWCFLQVFDRWTSRAMLRSFSPDSLTGACIVEDSDASIQRSWPPWLLVFGSMCRLFNGLLMELPTKWRIKGSLIYHMLCWDRSHKSIRCLILFIFAILISPIENFKKIYKSPKPPTHKWRGFERGNNGIDKWVVVMW